MKNPQSLSNEEIVRGVREKLESKNKQIAQLQKTVNDLQQDLSHTREEVNNRDKLFEMLSGLLGESS